MSFQVLIILMQIRVHFGNLRISFFCMKIFRQVQFDDFRVEHVYPVVFFRFPGSWCSTCWQVQPHEGEQGIVSAINDDDHLPINRGNYTILMVEISLVRNPIHDGGMTSCPITKHVP